MTSSLWAPGANASGRRDFGRGVTMMSDIRAQQEIESGVLSFRRERIEDGVLLARVAIRPGETSTPHYHPETHDTLYVMKGVLTVKVEVASGTPVPPYRAMCGRAPEISQRDSGGEIHTFRLHPGEILVIDPPAVHCTSNAGGTPCSFICIEGIGEYRFIPAEGVPPSSP